MKPHNLMCCSAILLLAGCVSNHISKNEFETVLKKGDVLYFANPNGIGSITYVSPFVRKYTVNEQSYVVRLRQREEEFRRQRGIYSPGEQASGRPPMRFVVEESIVRFHSLREINEFLDEGRDYFKWVSNNEGYVVGHLFAPERNQVNVSLYRFYLNGIPLSRVPANFPGHVVVRKINE